jgi:sugar lactone lactonase YvrE
MKVYINGTLENFNTDPAQGITSSYPLVIGNWKDQLAGDYGLDGLIDEVRVSKVSRSDAWIKASYHSQNNTLLIFNPGPLDHIVVSPDPRTVFARDTQIYTADGFDANNFVDDLTSECSFSIVEAGAGGTWTANVYASENSGTWTVRATHPASGKTDTATLTVLSQTYEFVTKWGSAGTGDGQFGALGMLFPLGVAVDSSGYIYVTDSLNHRIQKFTSTGTFVTKWGSGGTGDGQFYYPYGIAVDSSGYVYVTDQNNNRIQKFDSSGTFLGWWGRDNAGFTGWHGPGSGRIGLLGSGDGDFDHPYGITVDSSGYVYVVDTGNNRIQKFSSTGSFVTKWGSVGSGDGQFDGLWGIAVDSYGYVYVVDAGNNRIQKFDSSGTFLGWWGRDNAGFTGWHGPGSGRIGLPGSGDGGLYWPQGIAVDSSGYVYVVDANNCRIQKFTSSGSFVTKWGSAGNENGQFIYPDGIAVDSSGYVYVTDRLNYRIQKFRLSGAS